MGEQSPDPAVWYRSSFRRNLVDMHIPDWDERFMAQFNARRYVELLKIARVDTAMVYASSCLGICNWPTKAGHMHNGLKGRDLIGDVIEGCRENGINVIVYVNFWNKWAYENHPEWRFVSAEGKNTADYLGDKGRYGVCCFNTPYRTFMLAQINDLCCHYDFKGMWIDMIHWPYSPCFCHACKQRYLEEKGRELPEKANWTDGEWVEFQRTRERWLAEFAAEITTAIKTQKPDVSVGHQCASWPVGWQNGLTNSFFRQSDYVSGDFYGDAHHQSFTCKLLYHLSENKPFEFMTSRCPDLTDHTTTKSKEMLRAQAFSALLNGGAFLFIDAIDPAGTQDQYIYEMMGEIYGEIEKYESYICHDAEIVQDVAIYFNFESEIDLNDSAKPLLSTSLDKPVVKNAMSAAKSLMNANIPYGVITKKNLQELSQFSVIVLPNLLMIDEEEVEAFKQYVKEGGYLYASKNTSLLDKHGRKTGDFLLGDLFGVSYHGETPEEVTYMAPADRFGALFSHYSQSYPLTLTGSQIKVAAREGTVVAATMTLPYVHPKDGRRFSSAISNPPGIHTDLPSVVIKDYGKGKTVYCSGELESMSSDDHRDVFIRLISHLKGEPFSLESDAPRPVEITLFHHKADRKFTFRLLNFQSELPNIPVEGIRIRMKWDGKTPVRLAWLPDESPIDFELGNGIIEFHVPKLETFAMIVLEY